MVLCQFFRRQVVRSQAAVGKEDDVIGLREIAERLADLPERSHFTGAGIRPVVGKNATPAGAQEFRFHAIDDGCI